MLEIHQVPPSAVEVAEGIKIDMPAVAYVGIDDGVIVGSGGLAWGRGRAWIFFSTKAPLGASAGLRIIRFAKTLERKVAQLGHDDIYTPRDDQYATSKRLLTMLGYSHAETDQGVEIWRKVLGEPSPRPAYLDVVDC